MEGTLGAADRISFREGMREAALRRTSRERGLSGGLVKVSLWGIFAAQVLHTCAGAGSRQKVSEPIGLGKRFHRDHDRSGGRGWCWKSRDLD